MRILPVRLCTAVLPAATLHVVVAIRKVGGLAVFCTSRSPASVLLAPDTRLLADGVKTLCLLHVVCVTADRFWSPSSVPRFMAEIFSPPSLHI